MTANDKLWAQLSDVQKLAIRQQTNRDNAAQSTGPRTEEGKEKARYNAMRHGLAAQTLIVAETDLASFQRMNNKFLNDIRPEGATEFALVETMVFAHWQIMRARAIETNLLYDGAAANLNKTGDQQFDLTMGLAKTFEEKIKQLDLMSRYTTRHHRQFLQAEKRLSEIQTERKKAQQQFNEDRKRRQAEALAEHQNKATETQQNHPKPTTGFVPQPENSIPKRT